MLSDSIRESLILGMSDPAGIAVTRFMQNAVLVIEFYQVKYVTSTDHH